MSLPTSPPVPIEPARGWRTFLWLWGSQALSVLGSGLTSFALNIYLTQTRYPLAEQRPELALALSVTGLGAGAAAIFGAPLAGALADRWDRRRMMLTCDLLGAALMVLGALLVASPAPPLWLLGAFTVAGGLISTFHASAFDTSYRVLLRPEQLPRANGLMQTLWTLSGLLSPALAALLIGLPALARRAGEEQATGLGAGLTAWLTRWLGGWSSGVPLAFLLDALSFAVAALIVWRLSIPTPPREDWAAGQRPSLAQDMRFGWTFLFRRPALIHLLLTFAALNLLTGGVGVLHPLLVKFTLGPDLAARGLGVEPALATLWTSLSAGGLVGGLLLSTWGGLRRRRVLGVLIPMIGAGAAHALSGVAGTLPLAAACVAFFGLMVVVLNAHSQSIWQLAVPPEMQGRVFSVRRLVAQFTLPLSVALTGALAARVAPGEVLLWSGSLAAGVAALQLLNPRLRRVEDLPSENGQGEGRQEGAQATAP